MKSLADELIELIEELEVQELDDDEFVAVAAPLLFDALANVLGRQRVMELLEGRRAKPLKAAL
jgi:hypothetical protein